MRDELATTVGAGRRPGFRIGRVASLLLLASGCGDSTGPPPPPPPPPPDPPAVITPRIGVRTAGGIGEFYDRTTDRTFVPRGANYVRLAWQTEPGGTAVFYHSTFNSGLYEPSRAEAALERMQADGFNVVRVFLNGCCEAGIGQAPFGLSPAYLDNFADFLRRAAAHQVWVMPTTDAVPGFGEFGDSLNAYCCSPFADYNVHYLTRGGVNASALFWHDFVQGLLARRARVDAIFAYELRNELYFDSNAPPFSLASGTVVGANGHSYDMADPAAKRRLMDEGLVHWADRSRAAIRELVPTALVTVGFFVPQEPNPTRIGDPRVIAPYPAIAGSTVDFVDLHLYPLAGDLTFSQLVENFGNAAFAQKPVLMGEFGAYQPTFPTIQQAVQLLRDWQTESCAFGFKGWLLWTWDSAEQQDFPHWAATTADSSVERILAPSTRPDPCR